jgi:multisubunit Na+/H+ antiporter MnhG subunit
VSAYDGLVAVLLVAGVAAQLVCVLGVLVMRAPFDTLHYAAAGSTLGPLLIGTSLVLREVWKDGVLDLTAPAAETLAATAFVVLFSPVVTISTARAARRIEYGDLSIRPEEIVGRDES